MRKVNVRLSDEMAEKLEEISKKYGLRDMEETLRFAARFTTLTIERMEEKKRKAFVAVKSHEQR
jgi:metal-responsive CopG/Arc/MetJ family transcriptional regulator